MMELLLLVKTEILLGDKMRDTLKSIDYEAFLTLLDEEFYSLLNLLDSFFVNLKI